MVLKPKDLMFNDFENVVCQISAAGHNIPGQKYYIESL